jgi:hypothetical protein
MPTPKRQSANFAAQNFAKKLLEAPTYIKNLETRLQAGVLAPAVEAMLWHYAYGKPVETIEVSHHLDKLEELSDQELASLETELEAMPVSETKVH